MLQVMTYHQVGSQPIIKIKRTQTVTCTAGVQGVRWCGICTGWRGEVYGAERLHGDRSKLHADHGGYTPVPFPAACAFSPSSLASCYTVLRAFIRKIIDYSKSLRNSPTVRVSKPGKGGRKKIPIRFFNSFLSNVSSSLQAADAP